MQLEEVETTLQIVHSLSRGGRKYMEMCDKIRAMLSPFNSFPGIMDKLKNSTLNVSCKVLQDFGKVIIENREKYSQHHISRSIDSFNNAALGYSILFIRTHDVEFYNQCKGCIKQSIHLCKDFSQNDIQNCLSFIFNIGCYIFTSKEYSSAYGLFKVIILISSEIKNKYFQKLQDKAFKRIAICLLASNKHETEEFEESIRKCDDNEAIIDNLICLYPSTNPEKISFYIQNNLKSKVVKLNNENSDSNLNSQNNEYKQSRLIELYSYFALHGYFKSIPKESEFYSIYPYMKTPVRIAFKDPKIKQTYFLCNSYFNASRFLECNKEAISLLKIFPNNKLTPSLYVALLFIYYWIIESYIALDKILEARWYAKEMKKLFKNYPFTVGFASFLELKSRIHLGKLKRMKSFQPIEFTSNFNWSSVINLENAILCANEGSEECFLHFQILSESGNPIVKCESFHYYVTACRLFNIYPNIIEFKELCRLAKYSSALYIYHNVVQSLMRENICEFWNPINYINNGSAKKDNLNQFQKNMLENLKKAEKLASGYSVIMRKILQLEVLITGTCDTISSAFLLTSSLSQSLDRFIPSSKQKRFLIPFPILSIAYFDVVGLEECLLFALYHPNSKPIVVRIPCKDHFFKCLQMLDIIEDESTNVSSSLPPAEWWTKKKCLDDRLGNVIENIEKILGPWCGLLSPIIYNPHHSLAVNTLITSLISNPNLNDPVAEIMIKMKLFDGQIKSNSNSETKTEIMNFSSYSDIDDNDSFNSCYVKKIDTSIYTCVEKLPLALILGKTVHRVPWESLPIVLRDEVPITRIPSLRLVAFHCSEEQLPVNVDTNNAFFVLNPQGDLVTTQMTFNDVFVKEYEWKGLSGVPPAQSDVLNAIKLYDLFVYCGHGSGNEYFNYSDFVEMGIKCKSSMLLMGCRSAELNDVGDSDPRGVPMSLVVAGAGAVVGNLWNVTDRDIDRFLLDLLNRTVEQGPTELEKAVLHARSACKLKYLTGAAPIIYGFPTFFYNNDVKNRQSFGLSSILNS